MTVKDTTETLLTGNNAGFIETQFARYSEKPSSVSEDWQVFFRRMENGAKQAASQPFSMRPGKDRGHEGCRY